MEVVRIKGEVGGYVLIMMTQPIATMILKKK